MRLGHQIIQALCPQPLLQGIQKGLGQASAATAYDNGEQLTFALNVFRHKIIKPRVAALHLIKNRPKKSPVFLKK